jgi:hypothetical protein
MSPHEKRVVLFGYPAAPSFELVLPMKSTCHVLHPLTTGALI